MTSTQNARVRDLDTARLLERLGISVEDLANATPDGPDAPTFAEYVPIVSEPVSPGARRVYSTYWKRLVEQWGSRRITEPTASDIAHLREHVRNSVVRRANSRDGRSAAEHFIAAIRCLYKHAVADGYLTRDTNPVTTIVYTTATLTQVADAVAALTGEPHPLASVSSAEAAANYKTCSSADPTAAELLSSWRPKVEGLVTLDGLAFARMSGLPGAQ